MEKNTGNTSDQEIDIEKLEKSFKAIIQQFEGTNLTGQDIYQLSQEFITNLKQIAVYREYLIEAHIEENTLSDSDPEIVIAKSNNKRISGRKNQGFSRIIKSVISILLITLGFAMIILPAPPYFEVFTIFYFNEQDGFTLMDLISLLVVFSGVYSLIIALQEDKEVTRKKNRVTRLWPETIF